jgi:Fungal specific transcription factor domain
MSMSSDSFESPDAAPSRRTVPRLSSRPLKTLAPKPTLEKRPVSQRGANLRATSSGARLRSCPICPISQRGVCRLSSHESYVKKECKSAPQPGDGPLQPQSRQNAVSDTAYANSYVYRFAQGFVDRNIAAGRVDPFCKLPVPDSTHPQMHRLFHDCKHPPTFPISSSFSGHTMANRLLSVFTVQLNRTVNFPRPSCFTSDPVGGILAPISMIDPAVCLSVISMSAMAAGMRLGQQARNPSAQSLYSQATRVLRGRLSNNSRTDETILAATTLFVISTQFAVESAVRQTRKTVRDLVQARGGVSQLGMGGVLAEYVTMAEVLAALWMKDEPYVIGEAMPGYLTAPPTAIYGAAFYSPHILESLHPTMLEICFTMCRMTEVLEKALREDATPLEYVYFYSTLKWVSIRRAQFRARCYNSGTKDECISNVIEIFRSNVFSTQPENKSFNFGICSQLQPALVRTNISSYWEDQVQMLIWALFVVGTIEFEWESRYWFVDLLRRSISYKYANGDWPGTWRQEIMQSLKLYLWSELRFAESFARICDELERLAKRQAETGRSSLLAIGKQ